MVAKAVLCLIRNFSSIPGIYPLDTIGTSFPLL